MAAAGTEARKGRVENILKSIEALARLLTLTKDQRDMIHAANYKALREYAEQMLLTARGESNTMLKSRRRNLKGLSLEAQEETEDGATS